MVILHEAVSIMEGVDKVYDLKKDSDIKKTYYEPRGCLGTKIGKFDLPDGSGTAWFILGGDCVK